ncbi:SDR family NAD(P)-dependent oxidoreductase [soil metagenome]
MPEPPFSVDGLRIVIIGGTTGLGLSAARALVAGGASVVIVGRSADSMDRAVDTLAAPERVRGARGDATDPSTADTAVALAVSEFGALDALYHVAGGSGRSRGDGPLHELSDNGLAYTLDLNLRSLVFSNRAAVRQFRCQDPAGRGGAILNMGSVLGHSPSPAFFGSHAYAACKSAAVGFTRSVAAYYAKDNIRANVIAPALVETPMSERASNDLAIQSFIRSKQPLQGGRNGWASDLDAAALLLLSPAGAWITGQVLSVDGGWSVTEGQTP